MNRMELFPCTSRHRRVQERQRDPLVVIIKSPLAQRWNVQTRRDSASMNIDGDRQK